MAGTQPVAVYAMKVPAGDVMVPAVPDFAAMFRLSMAAIDPTAEPEFEEGDEKKISRATLKLIRVPNELFDDSDDSDDGDLEDEDDEDEEASDEGEANGGPSDPSKTKKPNKLDFVKALAEQESEDEHEEDGAEEEAAAKSALMKIMKGKGKATQNEEEIDDEDEDSLELEEVVICTLDPEKVLSGCPPKPPILD
jgi:FK506-binding nuclear protein